MTDNGFNHFGEYYMGQKLLCDGNVKLSDFVQCSFSVLTGFSEDDCVHEACLDVNKKTQTSTTEVENNQVTEDRADINDLGNPQNEPVPEEKDLLANRANVKDVQADEQDIQTHEDWTSSGTKKTTFQNHGFISEEHVESHKGNHFFGLIFFKGVVYTKMKILLSFNNPPVGPNPS